MHITGAEGPLIGAAVGGVASLAGTLLASLLTRGRDRRDRLEAQRIAVYEAAIRQALARQERRDDEGMPGPVADAVELLSTQARLRMYGSPATRNYFGRVVHAHERWETSLDPETRQKLDEYADESTQKLTQAIRREIGHGRSQRR